MQQKVNHLIKKGVRKKNAIILGRWPFSFFIKNQQFPCVKIGIKKEQIIFFFPFSWHNCFSFKNASAQLPYAVHRFVNLSIQGHCLIWKIRTVIQENRKIYEKIQSSQKTIHIDRLINPEPNIGKNLLENAGTT